MMGIYELGILGSPTSDERRILADTIGAMMGGFGLSVGPDVVLRDGSDVHRRDREAAFAAAYFGGSPHADLEATRRVVSQSGPVVPTVGAAGDFASEIPDVLRPSNGLRRRPDDPSLTELATALLECVGLLRRQRRVFVSYRRVEARNAALQMHEVLAERGFEVFLDTHDIGYGIPFQDELWHNLCDADLMLMFDTPGYFESRWTRQEIGRARAKGIHVLRAVWPAHEPANAFGLSETMFLTAEDLVGGDGPLSDATAARMATMVEALRSRSISARHLGVVGRLRAEVEAIGGHVAGIGAHRAIAVGLPSGRNVWAYPVVGIPSAQVLHDIVLKARQADQRGVPLLVYDEVGIGEPWREHLRWLGEHIGSVRTVKVHEAGWILAGMED